MNSLIYRWRALPQSLRIASVAFPIMLIIGIIVFCLYLNFGYYARTIKLVKTEGYVNLVDESGEIIYMRNNMRFPTGSTLSTGTDALATIAFDDSKLVTLQEDSEASFVKHGKKMELDLKAGGVFFDVNKPLKSDETFDIKTSTMVCGIRGTSGYVYIDEEGNSVLVLTSGHVHIIGTNPANDSSKETDVSAGQKLTVYVTPDSVEFYLVDITEADLSISHLSYLCGNSSVLNETCAATGWRAEVIRALAIGENPDDLIDSEPAETAEITDLTTESTTKVTETVATAETSESDETETSGTVTTSTTVSSSTGNTVSTTTTTTANSASTTETNNGGTTETTTTTSVATPTPKVTTNPSVTNRPLPTKGPTVTSLPTKAPTITTKPHATAVPSPTRVPTATSTTTPAPTKVPNITTTPAPTKEPAATATSTPVSTTAPTSAPIHTPTVAPTSTPVTTTTPTSTPIPTPTVEPTVTPTLEPEPTPAPEPTEEPTQEPTPTPEPTQEPTQEPTPDQPGDQENPSNNEQGEEEQPGTNQPDQGEPVYDDNSINNQSDYDLSAQNYEE